MKDKEATGMKSPKSPIRIPWWINVLLAIGSYCTLKFLIPELHLANPTFVKLAQAAPTFAPLTTIPFLLLAAKQLYDTDVTKGADDTQENNQHDEHDEPEK